MRDIFLSAGHSTVDPGAVAYGRKEADIAAEFRNMVSFYLHAASVKHVVDGAGTENVPLNDAVKVARKHSTALEFHCNSGPSSATGVETLSGVKDMELGSKLCAALANSLGIRNRGAKSEDSGQHHRLAFVQAGGVIVELFFLTNAYDLTQYDTRKWLAAKAVAEVLMQ